MGVTSTDAWSHVTADLAGMLLGALLVVSLSMLVYMALPIILMLPLKYAWRDLTYTDGSCKVEGAPWPKHSPGIGAGVYIPAREGRKERKIPINPQSEPRQP